MPLEQYKIGSSPEEGNSPSSASSTSPREQSPVRRPARTSTVDEADEGVTVGGDPGSPTRGHADHGRAPRVPTPAAPVPNTVQNLNLSRGDSSSSDRSAPSSRGSVQAHLKLFQDVYRGGSQGDGFQHLETVVGNGEVVDSRRLGALNIMDFEGKGVFWKGFWMRCINILSERLGFSYKYYVCSPDDSEILGGSWFK